MVRLDSLRLKTQAQMTFSVLECCIQRGGRDHRLRGLVRTGPTRTGLQCTQCCQLSFSSVIFNYYFQNSFERRRDSVIIIATGYELDDRGVGIRVSVKTRIFTSPCCQKLALGSTRPPIQWVPRAFSPGVKRQGHEADHLAAASAEVKKMWIYTSTPPYAFTT
jgi:hypothetical protein